MINQDIEEIYRENFEKNSEYVSEEEITTLKMIKSNLII